jgi:hypothetical protein
MGYDLHIPASEEFSRVLRAQQARRVDHPTLAAMVGDLRTIREVEREERAEDREERRERARLAKLERRQDLDRRAARRAEVAADRERARASRPPSWNARPRNRPRRGLTDIGKLSDRG